MAQGKGQTDADGDGALATKETSATSAAAAAFPIHLALTVTAEDLARTRQYADTHALCRAAERAGFGWAWHHGRTLEVGWHLPLRAARTWWCAYYALPRQPLGAGLLVLHRLRVEDWRQPRLKAKGQSFHCHPANAVAAARRKANTLLSAESGCTPATDTFWPVPQ